MAVHRATRPPRGLIALIVATTLVPLATLLWLGLRLFEQDRVLEVQQEQQRVERAADLVVAALQRAIAASEQRLAAGAGNWPEGAVALTFRRNSVEAFPPERLAFRPVVAAFAEAAPGAFARAQELEFRRRDHGAAANELRPLATASSNSAVRAGALFRLARNLQALSRTDEALDVYSQLTGLNNVLVEGIPAVVVGRYARCKVLESQRSPDALRVEVERLADALYAAGPMLTGPQYWLYADDVARWLGENNRTWREEEVFAVVAATLWDRWNVSPTDGGGSARRELLRTDQHPLIVLWQQANDAAQALLVTPRFVQQEWLEDASRLAQEHGMSLTLTGQDGLSLVTANGAPATSGASAAPTAVRSPIQAELPVGVIVTRVDQHQGMREFSARRKLMATGFILLVSMAMAASFFIVRSVNRELAVARLQSDFVAAVSHEFRTPLTTLRQFTDMLREHAALDDARRSVCYEAQSRATDRLTRLVESLLDFGRMEAGARAYRFERHDCGELVKAVVDDFRRQVEPAGYAVEYQTDGSCQIEADTEALSRALWNLLDNAVKYSPDHHSVEVALRGEGSTVSIAVHDRGIGVAPHERDAIFRRFQRGEEARARGFKGTGIGLAMVDHIVRAHRGHVQVESTPGKGSTFTVVLPVSAGS